MIQASRFTENLRAALPAIISVVLLVLFSVTTYIPGLSRFMPAIGLICVYFWRMHSPSQMPNWFIFIYGILADCLYGLPIGSTPIAYLIISALLNGYLRVVLRNGFIMSWFGFCLAIIIYQSVLWLTLSLYYKQNMPIENAAMQVFFSIMVYPLIHYLLGVLNNKVRKL